MKNYSLLRYPGGKTRAIDILKNFIPNDIKEICSPFFGGGSFELYLAKQGIKVHGYDNFEPLVCFWKSVLENKVKLFELVKKYYPCKKKEFYRLQKEILNLKDELEIGTIFYVLNRCSFSGIGLSGGMSPNHPRFTLSSIERLKSFNVEFNIKLMSFEKSILKHDCLIYADPPYFTNEGLYGVKGNMHKNFNHKLLFEILNMRGNFILSYNYCDEIKELYKDHVFFYPEWKYGMGNNKLSREILIVSKDLKYDI